MNRFVSASAVLVVASFAACTVYDRPPQNGQPQGGGQQPQPQPTAAPTATPTAAGGTTAPPANTIALPGGGGSPGGVPTFPPPGGGFPPPGGGGAGAPPAGGFTLPGVCIPIGSWSKSFDNGIPATGTVDIGTPVIFNQFPINDGVVIATMPAGSLKGVGTMTSTNDLSVDVSNGGYTVSYTCHFSGANCNQGACTVTKGGLSGFKLNKK